MNLTHNRVTPKLTGMVEITSFMYTQSQNKQAKKRNGDIPVELALWLQLFFNLMTVLSCNFIFLCLVLYRGPCWK